MLTYGSMNVVEHYKTMLLTDKKSGNVLGSAASGNCTPQDKLKYSTRTDYSNPMVVVYEPALLENNSFGVTLENGVLKSVNASSSPGAPLSAIAEVLPFAVAPKEAKSAIGKPLCNAGDKLQGVYEAPKIRPFSELKL